MFLYDICDGKLSRVGLSQPVYICLQHNLEIPTKLNIMATNKNVFIVTGIPQSTSAFEPWL